MSCATFKPRYSDGVTSSLSSVFDSIEKADDIIISDTNKWARQEYLTNNGIMATMLFYQKIKKRTYIMSVYQTGENNFKYNYRVE